MDPIEIFEYKRRWQNSAYEVEVDVDLLTWSRDFCKIHFSPEKWNFKKFYFQNDNHLFLFEEKEIAELFLKEYAARCSGESIK
jgi:hypothetical protein